VDLLKGHSMSADILAVARDISKTRADYDRVSEAGIHGEEDRRQKSVETILFYREEALHDLLSTLPSTTLVEATIQIGLALGETHFIDGNNFKFDSPDKDKACRKVLRLLSSALRVLIRETGIDPNEFGIDAELVEEIPA
jgi:hypothetical protein